MQWSWTTETVSVSRHDGDAAGGKMFYERGQKGLLGGGVWRWKHMLGGVSEVFDLPGLPGAKKKDVPSAVPVPVPEETILASRGGNPEAGKAKKVVDV